MTPCLTHQGQPKRRYRGRHEAERAARLVRRETGLPTRVYWCVCGAYHVTTLEEYEEVVW